MEQGTSSKQSILIGALSGALVLSIGIATFFYLDSKKQHDVDKQKAEVTAQEISKNEIKKSELPSNEVALKELFSDSAYGENMTFWFEQSFNNGPNKYHVKFFKTKKPDSDGQMGQDSVGVITYKENLGSWELMSKQENFTKITGYGISEKNPKILEFSPISTALLLDESGGGQGIFHSGKLIFVYSQNSWRNLGSIETESNNEGDCDMNPEPNSEVSLGPCWSYKGEISVVNGAKSDFPDLLVTRTGTESLEHRVSIRPAKNVTYIFKDGKYIDPNEPQ